MKSIVCLFICLFAGAANAAIVTYTDRGAWEAAVSGDLTTEDFNSNSGNVTALTTFPSGVTISGSGLLDITGFAFGDIGEGTALRGSTFDISFPSTDVNAFGFDYADLDFTSATLVVIGGQAFNLALTGDADSTVTPDDFAFFGVIADSAAEIGGGFGLSGGDLAVYDNLSFTSTAVSEPGSLALLGLGLAGLGFVRRNKKA